MLTVHPSKLCKRQPTSVFFFRQMYILVLIGVFFFFHTIFFDKIEMSIGLVNYIFQLVYLKWLLQRMVDTWNFSRFSVLFRVYKIYRQSAPLSNLTKSWIGAIQTRSNPLWISVRVTSYLSESFWEWPWCSGEPESLAHSNRGASDLTNSLWNRGSGGPKSVLTGLWPQLASVPSPVCLLMRIFDALSLDRIFACAS